MIKNTARLERGIKEVNNKKICNGFSQKELTWYIIHKLDKKVDKQTFFTFVGVLVSIITIISVVFASIVN